MARPYHLACFGGSLLNKQSLGASAFICRLIPSTIQNDSSSSHRLCSSKAVYKIDHSGFVNPLEPNPPKNNELGIRDKVVNRNPRVLEHLNIADRQNGWKFQAPKRNYINKLVIDTKGRAVLAYIEHSSGEKVRRRV